MLRPFKVLNESDLERELLRKGVGALTAGRHACSDCGRTPLVGERVFRFRRGTVVCALCAGARRTAPEGEEIVHSGERGHTVRPLLHRAA